MVYCFQNWNYPESRIMRNADFTDYADFVVNGNDYTYPDEKLQIVGR